MKLWIIYIYIYTVVMHPTHGDEPTTVDPSDMCIHDWMLQ